MGVLAAALLACSTKTGPRDAAAGADTAASPDTPADGTTGLDGAIDVAASGGTDGRAPKDDAAGSLTMSAEQACFAVVNAQCDRRAFCSAPSSSTPAPSGCGDAYPCPSYYFAPGSRRTVENLEACLAVLKQVPCTDSVMGIIPGCLVGGDRQGGEPCAFGSQCASGSCSGGTSSCGSCAVALETGQACGGGQGFCRAGSFCHRTMKVCMPVSAIVHAPEGSPCDLAANPMVSCEGDLICNTGPSSSSYAGTCMRPPGDGQPCANVGDTRQMCTAGLTCGIVTTSGNRVLTCGQAPCGSRQCPSGSYCYEDPNTPLNCRPYLTEGQTCVPGTLSTLCAPTTSCDPRGDGGTDGGTDGGAEGLCTKYTVLKRGDPCSARDLCPFPLGCVNGVCAGVDPTSCTARDAAAGG